MPVNTINHELEVARFIVEKTNSNLFLTGKAGTGKTTFLRDVVRHTKKTHVVLAPTGVAAVNAGAMTIHSFFQFGFGPFVNGVSVPEAAYNMRKSKLDLIKKLELIVIDEISMVRADLLDHVDYELKRIRKNQKPFGGIQLLMIGDLQQLPPISKGEEGALLDKYYDTTYFFGSKALRNSDYYCIELSHVYRQKDSAFIKVLNHARDGRLTDADLSYLNARYNPNFVPPRSVNYINLVTHNAQADEINEAEMAKLPGRLFSFDAKVTGSFPKDAFPTSEELSLKKGAQVMFVKNDPDKQFVNGTIGTITDIDSDSVYVKPQGSSEEIEVEPVQWESIRYKLDEESGKIVTETSGKFKQLPIKPAWAITIHKSQGLTFDNAIIDVNRAFSPGQAYVALSRCRSIEGIVLRNKVTNSVFKTDSLIDEYMEGAAQDIDELARTVSFVPIEYEDSEANVVDNKSSKARKEPIKPLNKAVNSTQQLSYQMYKDGLSVELIAKQRGLQVDTILGHLSKFVESGDLEYKDFVSDNIISKVKYFKKKYPEEDSLGVMREYYQNALSYGEINMALAAIAWEEKHGKRIVVQPEQPAEKKDSKQITLELFQKGYSIREIALERSMAENTIENHLAFYVKAGEVDAHDLVKPENYQKIEDYILRHHPDALKPIFEHFDGKIPYSEIRFVRAEIESDPW